MSKVEFSNEAQEYLAPALQLSLYKLIATTDERNALSMSKVDVTSEGLKITWNEVRTYDKPS